MVRKLNINGEECTGASNALIAKYIVGKIISNVKGKMDLHEFYISGGMSNGLREEISSLCRVTITREEAKTILCLDDKEITDMAIELYPNVDEEELEDIVRDSIDEIILEAFEDLMMYNETFYENGCTCSVNAFTGMVFKKDIELEVSPNYVELCYRKSTDGFYIISLDSIQKLTYEYSIRLYEGLMHILSSYRRNEIPAKFKMPLDKVKQLLRIHGSKYEKYGDLKRRILMPAIEEINQLEYNITFNEIKEGRKVVAIEFEINKKK